MTLANKGLASWPIGSLVPLEVVDGQGQRWQYACTVVWQAGSSIGLSLPAQAPIPADLLAPESLPVRLCRVEGQTVPLPALIRLSPFCRRTLLVSPTVP